MPIDINAGSEIPLAANPAPAPPSLSVSDMLAKWQGIRNSRQQAQQSAAASAQALQEGAQTQQANALELQQKAQDLKDQQIFSKAMQDAGGDPQKAFIGAAQGGASGKFLVSLQQGVLKNRETQATIDKTNADAAKANADLTATRNDRIKEGLGAVLQVPPDQRADAFMAEQTKLIQNGDMAPEQALPSYQAYGGDASLMQHYNLMLTEKDRRDKASADLKLKTDAADAAHKAAMAPSEETAAQNTAITGAPNAAGLTPEQQATADREAAAAAETKRHNAASEAVASGDLAIKRKTFDETFGVGTAARVDNNGKPLTGDAFLAALPPGRAAQVKAFANGQLTEADLPRGNAKQPFLDAVLQYDPGFTKQAAETRKDFGSAGASGKNIQSLNTASVHLDQLGEAAIAMANGSFVPGNAALNALRATFGGSAPTNFEGLKTAVASEMASALKGNATDQEIAANAKTISGASSPKQLADIVNASLHVLGAKLNTKDEQYHKAVPGDADYSPVLPTAAGVFTKHGIQPIQRLAQPSGAAQGGYIVGRKYGDLIYGGGDPNVRASWK